jgi:hypothetical protein
MGSCGTIKSKKWNDNENQIYIAQNMQMTPYSNLNLQFYAGGVYLHEFIYSHLKTTKWKN